MVGLEENLVTPDGGFEEVNVSREGEIDNKMDALQGLLDESARAIREAFEENIISGEDRESLFIFLETAAREANDLMESGKDAGEVLESLEKICNKISVNTWGSEQEKKEKGQLKIEIEKLEEHMARDKSERDEFDEEIPRDARLARSPSRMGTHRAHV